MERIPAAATSSSAASNLKIDNKTIALYNADAKLMAEFEQYGMSGNFFNYCNSVPSAPSTVSTQEQMTSYLTKIQRETSMLNPIMVHSRSNRKSFYAILHRIDVGIVIDLEPSHGGDPAAVHAGAVRSQKLAVRVISRLQSLPGGDVGALCDVVVEDVQRLTGYDRVMAYKFHEDNHGEVVAEIRRSDLDPYLGVHYPATDIPQAVRFLFKQNRVRMIHDCKAKPKAERTSITLARRTN